MRRLTLLCTYCHENLANPTKTFDLGAETMSFCSDIHAELFIELLSVKDRKLIFLNQCCSSPQFIQSRGTVVCTNCGMDLQEPVYDMGPEFQKREGMSLKNLEDRNEFYLSVLSYIANYESNTTCRGEN